MMLRNLLKWLLLVLAKRAITKYETRLIVVYGWDWSEVIRESLYFCLQREVNVRRNTEWIKWDLGLPLFILGYNYQTHQSTLKLIWTILKACLRLIWPGRHKNYLVVSLHAKTIATLSYWLQLKLTTFIYLPERDGASDFVPEEMLNLQGGTGFIDLRKQAVPTKIPLEEKAILLLEEIAKQSPDPIMQGCTKERLEIALLKSGWGDFILSRIRANLLKSR